MAIPYKNAKKHSELSNFGNAIRIVRKSKRISQEKLAELSGIDRSYMGGIERGEHNISLINIHKIANALELPIACLMNKAGL